MKATEMSIMGSTLSTVVLGILAALLILATLTGRKVPFIQSDQAALIVLVVLGMAMCASGIGRVASLGAWTHPLTILGILLGVAILLVAGAALFGKALPFVATTRHAIVAVALLSSSKLILSTLHRFLS